MNGKDVGMRWEAVSSFAANVIVLAIEFAIIVLLARELGAEGVGTYFFIITLAVVLNRPTSAIAGTMEKRASEVNTDIGRYFGLSIVVAVVYLSFVLLIGYAMVRGVAEPYVTLTGTQYLSFIAIIFGRSLYSMARRLYKAVGHPGAAMWVHTIRDGLFLPAFLIVIDFGGGALAVVITRAAVLAVVASVILVRIGIVPRTPTRAVAERTYSYARWHLPSSVTSTLLGRLPILLLGTFVGSSAVGLYQAAYRITELGPYVGTCVKGPLLVKLSGVTSDGLDPRPYLRTAMSYTPIVAAPVLAMCVTAPDLLLRVIYGTEFANAGTVLVVIAVGELMFAQSRTGKAALNGSDNPSYSFLANILALCISIPTAVVLLPSFGALGGALLFLVSETVIFAVVFVAGYRVFDAAILGGRFLLVVIGASVVFGVVFRGFVAILSVTTLPLLGIAVSASVVAYVGTLALGSQSFRAGTIATVRDVQQRLQSLRP